MVDITFQSLLERNEMNVYNISFIVYIWVTKGCNYRYADC
jgi:hypothetical protein